VTFPLLEIYVIDAFRLFLAVIELFPPPPTISIRTGWTYFLDD